MALGAMGCLQWVDWFYRYDIKWTGILSRAAVHTGMLKSHTMSADILLVGCCYIHISFGI